MIFRDTCDREIHSQQAVGKQMRCSLGMIGYDLDQQEGW